VCISKKGGQYSNMKNAFKLKELRKWNEARALEKDGLKH
jgi:hypothetical protein